MGDVVAPVEWGPVRSRSMHHDYVMHVVLPDGRVLCSGTEGHPLGVRSTRPAHACRRCLSLWRQQTASDLPRASGPAGSGDAELAGQASTTEGASPMTTTLPEPAPAPDMSRAVPTTKALRASFAALDAEDKVLVRFRVAFLVADGSKVGAAWTQAFADLIDPIEESESPLSTTAVAVGSLTFAHLDNADRDALYAEAVAAKKAGPRGKGRSLTEPEFVGYITEVRSRYPESTRRRECEIAYWLERIALSVPRWDDAWAEVAS